MRRARIKVEGEGFYHVVSRIGGRRLLIDETEKRVLLGMIRSAAAFCGVELYTFAIMSNHFHLLVRVPRKRDVPDAELVRRMEALYGKPRLSKVLEKWEKWKKKSQESRVEEEKARLRARMYDLSQFCKTFKETYTQDYNRRHDNTGTIWEGRFKSILLEGSYRAMMTVAGYIHLNPVRAKMAESAEKAKCAGYGAACQGDSLAIAGLVSLARRVLGSDVASWDDARGACAEVIRGRVPESPDSHGAPEDGNDDASSSTVQAPADVSCRSDSFQSLLNRRVAGFLHGGVLGGDNFLKRMSEILPQRARRKSSGVLDKCGFLGFATASGVREVS